MPKDHYIELVGKTLHLMETLRDEPEGLNLQDLAARTGQVKSSAHRILNSLRRHGYVEQEVQFRFDNGVWNAHQRKRGVEVTVEGRTPHDLKETPNHHYNGTFLEPWGERSQRGYGIEVLRRFFEEVAGPQDPTFNDVLIEDYHDHDPARPQDAIGMDAIRREVGMWRAAFDFSFTVEDQMAQGDRVCTRWTWNGRHTGDFMGIPATGKEVSMTGCTIHRCTPDGKIAEGWWQYDRLGLMEQLGALEDLES